MAFDISAVATAIAALSISGVTIKTEATLPDALFQRDCPVLYPQDEFITGLNYELQSAGATSPVYEITFTLNYYLAVGAVGAGRGLRDHKETIRTKASLIADAVADAHTTFGVDYIVPKISSPEVVPDAADNQFYGCVISFACRLFDNK
jgi:hypothetical protein